MRAIGAPFQQGEGNNRRIIRHSGTIGRVGGEKTKFFIGPFSDLINIILITTRHHSKKDNAQSIAYMQYICYYCAFVLRMRQIGWIARHEKAEAEKEAAIVSKAEQKRLLSNKGLVQRMLWANRRKDNTAFRRGKSVADAKMLEYGLRANRKGLQFYLCLSDFVALETMTCMYCGGKPSGYDRIDSKTGYIRSNIVPCCATCNLMKYTSTYQSFMEHIKKIYHHNYDRNNRSNRKAKAF